MRGAVYIAPVDEVPADGSMVDPAVARFWASWQDDDLDGPAALLEEVDLDSADAAIAWGRKRSEIVLIRLGHRGDTYFSAGSSQPRDDPMPAWPPPAPPPDGWWSPGNRSPKASTGRLGAVEPETRES